MSHRAGGKPKNPPGSVEAKVDEAWRRARPALALTMIFGALAVVAGPLICGLLIYRGVREGRWSWLALGALCALPLVLILVGHARRMLRTRPAPPR